MQTDVKIARLASYGKTDRWNMRQADFPPNVINMKTFRYTYMYSMFPTETESGCFGSTQSKTTFVSDNDESSDGYVKRKPPVSQDTRVRSSKL
jgi:hypothetical protein